MGCCACCLSEDGQIKEILDKIEVVKASSITHGDTKFAVGRTVQVQGHTLVAPVSQKPCVYYEVRCEKEHQHTDDEGHTHTSWSELFREIRSVDFLLSDGEGQPVYVPASNSSMKVYAVEDCGGEEGGRMFKFRPEMSDNNPHLQSLLDRHGADGRGGFFGDGPKIRYYEGSFAVNEQVAVLGTASQGNINGVAVMSLAPAASSAYNETYFEQHGWSGLEQKCWASLTANPSLIGTDDGRYMKGIQISVLGMNYNANSLAVPIQQPMVMQGQQPMMMQGQQPMVTQGQQPMMMQGQQPMVMQGQQPMMMQGQQPMMMQGQQPMMMQGQQPMVMQGQQPMMMQGQQPMVMQGQQPMMMQGQQPMVMQGNYAQNQVVPVQ